jgi:hypothetical protein
MVPDNEVSSLILAGVVDHFNDVDHCHSSFCFCFVATVLGLIGWGGRWGFNDVLAGSTIGCDLGLGGYH